MWTIMRLGKRIGQFFEYLFQPGPVAAGDQIADNGELYFVALCDAGTVLDPGYVDKVLFSIITCNKSKLFHFIKEFYCSFGHNLTPKLYSISKPLIKNVPVFPNPHSEASSNDVYVWAPNDKRE